MPSKRPLSDSSSAVTKSAETTSQSQPVKRARLSGEQDLLQYPRTHKPHQSHGSEMLMVYSDLYKTVVTVYVGPDSYAFTVYKELLCHDSPFFKAALEGSFKEGDEQTVSLPDDEVETFKIYQTWLNTLQLRYNFDHEEWWLCFAKIWVFADKIGSPTLKNRTVDALCATINSNDRLDWPSPRAVYYTFDNTSSDSPLRKLAVNYAYCMHKGSLSPSQLEEYPIAFVCGLTSYLLRHVQYCGLSCDSWGSLNEDLVENFESCQYHIDCSDKCCTVTSSKKTSGKLVVKRQHRV